LKQSTNRFIIDFMYCEDKAFMRFCAQNRSELVCCNTAVEAFPDQRCQALPIFEEAVLGQIPELEEMLPWNGTIKLRTWGTCMFPSIRPRDILHIEPVLPDRIRVEDIIVFRHDIDLLAHRVILIDRRGNDTWILTRADNTWHTEPIRVRIQDILGRVTSIERKNRMVSTLSRRNHHCLLRSLICAYIYSYGCATLAERVWIRFLGLQCRGLRFGIAIPISASADCRFFVE